MLILIYIKGQSSHDAILKDYIKQFKNKDNLEHLPDSELKQRIVELHDSLQPTLYQKLFHTIAIEVDDKATLNWLSNNSRQLVITPPVVIDHDRSNGGRPRVYHLTNPDYDEVYLAHYLDSM